MSDLQERALAYLKGELGEGEQAAFEAEMERSPEARLELDRSRALLELLRAANDEAVVRRVERMIEAAVAARATDIHIVPERGSTGVWIRVDGNLREIERMERSAHEAVVDRWKVRAGCGVEQRKLPQDGRVPLDLQGREVDLRVSFLPTVHGERVTVRIVDRQKLLLGLDRLGLSDARAEALRRLSRLPRGFVITTGNAESGKTTLLYSMLLEMLKEGEPRRTIFTVEDPVEVAFDGISQMPVDKSGTLPYAQALRAIFRSDPDVVMIAEIRNQETADIATELATTGHLVLTVLHTASALLIPKRLVDIGVVPHLAAQNLRWLVGQRLVRRNCPHCLEEYEPAVEELTRAGLTAADGPFRRGRGCDACGGTGVQGRVGLFEVVEVDEALRELIGRQASFDQLWEASFGRTGGSLRHDGREKARQGLTTVERANRALFDYPDIESRPPAY